MPPTTKATTQTTAKTRARRSPRRAELVQEAYLHILGDRPRTTASLARVLGVSAATTSRVLEDLRRDLSRKGMAVVSVRSGRSWRYLLTYPKGVPPVDPNDPLVRLVGSIKTWDEPRFRTEDDEIYEDR